MGLQSQASAFVVTSDGYTVQANAMDVLGSACFSSAVHGSRTQASGQL